MLFEDYLKAVSDLSISDEECIKVEVKKLQTESVEIEFQRH